MITLGGYFELELAHGEEYHCNALRLNTGRNALEYILRSKKYSRVFLPFYTCSSMLEPLNKLKIMYEFYSIDSSFTPVFDFSGIGDNDVFVYINYFGLCDEQVSLLTSKCKNLIIDNSQAFFSKPIQGADTFYSPRKFFGVPDGSYLYTDKKINCEFEQDISYKRFEHLLGRIDIGAETFYNSFKENSISLVGQPIKTMSKLTTRILQSLDYENIEKKRKENFIFLHNALKSRNKLNFDFENTKVPMVYPYLVDNGSDLKRKLIESKVFVPTYWPNIINTNKQDSYEYLLASRLTILPVDQRYDTEVMLNIIDMILYLSKNP